MAGRALATARLSSQAQRLPCVQAEAHPVYRLHHTGAMEARVVDFQILHLQQWRHYWLLVLRTAITPPVWRGALSACFVAKVTGEEFPPYCTSDCATAGQVSPATSRPTCLPIAPEA